MRVQIVLTVLLIRILAPAHTRADEGMWLYNHFPKQRVAEKYGSPVTDQMLDHWRLSSVRLGASASFVSPHGLIFTNHHVGLSCVQRVSTPERNYVRDGFLARTPAEEIPCPATEASVLEQIEDVTAKVNAGLPDGAAEASRRRQAAIAAIEKECAADAGAQCEVVTLYSGARYHLYRYKRYSDIRLVFTPELALGFFGGDPDNFTYPRYCLDITFFRAYENGKAADTPHYLTWSREGVREGELIFVSGHPAGSSRLATTAELRFRRDRLYPAQLDRLRARIAALNAFGGRSRENARQARAVLFSAENVQKRLTGFLAGLRDPVFMSRLEERENKLRAAVRDDPRIRDQYGGVWDEAARAIERYQNVHGVYSLLETGAATGSDLFFYARTALRLAEESSKPNEERLREYTEARLPSLERRLYSSAPVFDALETAILAEYFRCLARELGASDPLVKSVLGGRRPEEAARRYVSGSKLRAVAERRRLAGSAAAVEASGDGMILLARLLDGPARRARKQYEDEVEAALTAAKTKIALARFDLHGVDEYPDSTGTLRLAYGTVKGYRNQAGDAVPYATTLEGLFARATGRDPYALPRRWLDARKKLDPATPFNFVGTTDTHGGNSGSPTINARGELVGILFDSNLEKLPNEFLFTEENARSVHVASQGIIEALRKVYGADALVSELLGR